MTEQEIKFLFRKILQSYVILPLSLNSNVSLLYFLKNFENALSRHLIICQGQVYLVLKWFSYYEFRVF